MFAPERRQAANAALRQKIDQLQAVNQTLKTSTDELADWLIESARQPGVWSMSDSQRAVKRLEKMLQSQSKACLGVQADITGEVSIDLQMRGDVPLLSSDEMAALMQLQS